MILIGLTATLSLTFRYSHKNCVYIFPETRSNRCAIVHAAPADADGLCTVGKRIFGQLLLFGSVLAAKIHFVFD